MLGCATGSLGGGFGSQVPVFPGTPLLSYRVASRLQIFVDNHHCQDQESPSFPFLLTPCPFVPGEKGTSQMQKEREKKTKLFSVPDLQSWDREVVEKNHAPTKKICERILGSKKEKKWGEVGGKDGWAEAEKP